MRSVFLYLSVIIALFTGIAAKAQAEPAKEMIPKVFQGSWAMPDCGEHYEALVITSYFYLHTTEETARLLPIYPVSKAEDYHVLSLDGIEHPVHRTADSVLQIGDMDDIPRQKWGPEWETLALTGRTEYAGCHDVPDVVPLHLIKLIRQLDSLRTACHPEMTKRCKNKLFSMTDTDKNKRLSLSEIKNVSALAFLLVPLSSRDPMPREGLRSAYDYGMDIGTNTAKRLLAMHDQDGSGDLDNSETAGIITALKTPDIEQAREQIAPLFPALGISVP